MRDIRPAIFAVACFSLATHTGHGELGRTLAGFSLTCFPQRKYTIALLTIPRSFLQSQTHGNRVSASPSSPCAPSVRIEELRIRECGVTHGAMRPVALHWPRIGASPACRVHFTSLQAFQRAIAHSDVDFLLFASGQVANHVDSTPNPTLFALIAHFVRCPDVIVLRQCARALSSWWPYTLPPSTPTSSSWRTHGLSEGDTSDKRPWQTSTANCAVHCVS